MRTRRFAMSWRMTSMVRCTRVSTSFPFEPTGGYVDFICSDVKGRFLPVPARFRKGEESRSRTRPKRRLDPFRVLLLRPGALRMGAPGCRDVGDGVTGRSGIVGLGQVADRNDPHQPLLAVDHLQAPHLHVAHVLRDVLELLIVEAVEHFLAHDLAHFRRWRLLLGHGARRDVGVGDHPDQAVALAHGERAGVDFGHQPRGLRDRLLRAYQTDSGRHDFAHSHVDLLGKGGLTGGAARCSSIARARPARALQWRRPARAIFDRRSARAAPESDATLSAPTTTKRSRPMSTRIYVFAAIATLSSAPARAAEEAAAYLIAASDGAPVITASGACVRTGQWTPGAGYRNCDPLPMAKLIPAAVEPTSSESPLHAEPIRIAMNTLFDFDSAVLRADAAPALDALAKQLTQASYQKIDIVGHADRMGAGKYNQKLSEQRAEAVRDYLLAQGLDGTRLTAFGVGNTEPLTGKECRGLRGKPLVYCLQRGRYTEGTVLGTQTSALR